jgi:hypothetical protein
MNTMNQIIEELLRTRGDRLERDVKGIEFKKLRYYVRREFLKRRRIKEYGEIAYENEISAMVANQQILPTRVASVVFYRLENDPVNQHRFAGTLRHFATPFADDVSDTLSQLSVRDSVPSSISASYPDRKRQRLLLEEQQEHQRQQQEHQRILAEQQDRDRLLQQEQERQRLLLAEQERQRLLLEEEQQQHRDRLLQQEQERQRLLLEEQERQRLLLEEEQQQHRDRLLQQEQERQSASTVRRRTTPASRSSSTTRSRLSSTTRTRASASTVSD